MQLSSFQLRLENARRLAQSGDALVAEARLLELLGENPASAGTLAALAGLALQRSDTARALGFLERAVSADPGDLDLALYLAETLAQNGHLPRALGVLTPLLQRVPGYFPGWLLLGRLRDISGDGVGALRAWYQAVTRSQSAGHWMDTQSTPAHLVGLVSHAVERVRVGCRELLLGSYENLRQQIGSEKLQRVDLALTGFLGEWDASPPDARQRPKFFHFPGLPVSPYLDPFLHSWAPQLQAAFPAIRREALAVWAEDRKFENFLELSKAANPKEYLQGEGENPSWEAFFFYRHGRRNDANHRRCPETSAVLESLELCRVEGQAPEICFSVLSPGSHIMPHYGVTNTRTVMHLPLVVPTDCALNIIDAGEHAWKEGELMLFDDTFQHEAWNRSSATRIVLLMDCWNPHLTPDERIAVKQLVETISSFQNADQFA